MSKFLRGKNEKGKGIKIEHTTYEENHRSGRSTSRPTSASQKVKDYFSTRFSHSHENSTKERPVIMWPSDTHPAFEDIPFEYQKQSQPSQPLRHKGKLADMSKSFDNPLGNGRPDRKIENLRQQRRDIRDGRMEMTLPRMTKAEEERRFAPPRPSSSSKKHFNILSSGANTPSGSALNSRKNSKTDDSRRRSASLTRRLSEGVTANISAGIENLSIAGAKMYADFKTGSEALVETRRDLQDKFSAPFENITRPRFSLNRKASTDTIASFFCQGEGAATTAERDANAKAIAALKERQNTNAARRQSLTQQGTDPWTQSAPKACRLCNKLGVRGVRGLCRFCEESFMQPKLAVTAIGGGEFPSDYCQEEERRPTPPKDYRRNQNHQVKPTPLKDYRTLSMKKSHHAGPSSKPLPPTPSSSPKLTDSRVIPQLPQINNQFPRRHASQSAQVEVEVEDWRQWQTRSQREEYDYAKREDQGWDLYFDEEEGLLGENRIDKCKGKGREKERDYGYWDDILDDW